MRTLILPTSYVKSPDNHTPNLEVSDTLTTVSFRGAEYIIAPGTEGVASLIFDVPKYARGVRGGPLQGGEGDEGAGERERLRTTESLFEIRCAVSVKIGMGFGRLVFVFCFKFLAE